MNPAEFVHKWKDVALSERSACQQHLLDLCDLVDHPKPAEVDKTGESFTFEKGAEKHGGGQGWADVWKKGFFGWEYKKKRPPKGVLTKARNESGVEKRSSTYLTPRARRSRNDQGQDSLWGTRRRWVTREWEGS